ncbi:hypothetical protein HOLleu_11896 [Holothuria leucospilota]|uniref:arylamine N-acetyltransferase n=1 Tax=Holothuria leucospilota TaxID=206669 RepID=A0A9Q1HDC7_HOLLE|nr:hypothetical protein HOLleu_11896 [Holothuria leucospilota]
MPLKKPVFYLVICKQLSTSVVVLLRKLLSEDTDNKNNTEDDISYNLTKHEALTYLENVLGIPDPVSFVNKNKVAFLQEMMRQTNVKVPFTNIMALSFREDGIQGPSLNEIKQALYTRQGGHCMAINSFTSAVLQCLGFDTILGPALTDGMPPFKPAIQL